MEASQRESRTAQTAIFFTNCSIETYGYRKADTSGRARMDVTCPAHEKETLEGMVSKRSKRQRKLVS